MAKYTFSGHETFYCRHYWLKKGYDFLKAENNFYDDNAVTKLGVGKNMVTSIRFWLRAFDILTKDKDQKNADIISELGEFLFSQEGVDPYLEDVNSLWLLHYHLVKKGWASIYQLFFNKVKNGDREFSDDKIKKELIYQIEREQQDLPSDKTLNSDIKVLRANYLQPRKSNHIEDDFIGLLQELNLFEQIENKKMIIQNSERDTISHQLFLYTILDRFEGRKSISVEEIIFDDNSPGIIFCMSEYGVLTKLKEIEEKNPKVVLKEDAGIRELQLSKDLVKSEVLRSYYE